MTDERRRYPRVIWAVAGGIALFATIQGAWAIAVGAPQFLRDATEWVYDVVLYGIAALVFGHGKRAEAVSAAAIAATLFVAGAHTVWDLWDKVAAPRPIDPALLGFSAASAIAIGYIVVAALWRFRGTENPLILATWISARNDAIVTTVYAALTFAARTASTRWGEYGLDLLGAALAFQGSAAIALTLWRDRRDGRPDPADLSRDPAAREG